MCRIAGEEAEEIKKLAELLVKKNISFSNT